MNKAVFLDLASLAPEDLDISALQAVADDWESYPASTAEQVVERLAGAQVAIINKVCLSAEILAALPDLRLICITATGTNNVDLAAAAAQGIVVSNVTAYATESVAQHVMAVMLAHHTRLMAYHQAVLRGEWSRSEQFCLLDYPVRELSGLILGIVGFGELGQGVARLAEAFGMQVLVAQRPGSEPQAGRLPLDELLGKVDVLSLHVPLAENTQNLIDARRLRLMKDSALLINTARGQVVDNHALAAALSAGQIGGAAIDVLEQEPPPLDHPLLSGEVPNLILTPHTAWAGKRARQAVVDQTLANIQGWLRGEPRNQVTA